MRVDSDSALKNISVTKNMNATSPTPDTLSASILSNSAHASSADNDYLGESNPIKRALDIVGAIVGIILSAPLIAAFGFLIYRESPGSVIYKQTRVGRDSKPFTIFKLRSMKLDSETAGAGWTVENDPRCLRVGKLIRAWNIDEVPQFWNVLKGDMSLVGPRPERPEHIERLSEEIPGWDKRLAVKPGLTGWAQVNGWRGDTSLQERIRHDIDYIRRGNLWFDLVIMAKTLINRENAY